MYNETQNAVAHLGLRVSGIEEILSPADVFGWEDAEKLTSGFLRKVELEKLMYKAEIFPIDDLVERSEFEDAVNDLMSNYDMDWDDLLESRDFSEAVETMIDDHEFDFDDFVEQYNFDRLESRVEDLEHTDEVDVGQITGLEDAVEEVIGHYEYEFVTERQFERLVEKVEGRGFFGRLKWLVLGK